MFTVKKRLTQRPRQALLVGNQKKYFSSERGEKGTGEDKEQRGRPDRPKNSKLCILKGKGEMTGAKGTQLFLTIEQRKLY